jgi:hypothetical protein
MQSSALCGKFVLFLILSIYLISACYLLGESAMHAPGPPMPFLPPSAYSAGGHSAQMGALQRAPQMFTGLFLFATILGNWLQRR